MKKLIVPFAALALILAARSTETLPTGSVPVSTNSIVITTYIERREVTFTRDRSTGKLTGSVLRDFVQRDSNGSVFSIRPLEAVTLTNDDLEAFPGFAQFSTAFDAAIAARFPVSP